MIMLILDLLIEHYIASSEVFFQLFGSKVWEHPLSQMEVRGSKSQAYAFELIGQFVCLCVLSVNWCVCVCVLTSFL